jgi:hypothetical protein
MDSLCTSLSQALLFIAHVYIFKAMYVFPQHVIISHDLKTLIERQCIYISIQ